MSTIGSTARRSESKVANGVNRMRRTSKTARAFIVEALVLFAFLVAMLAIVSQILFSSAATAASASDLEQAIFMSSNAAERFSMDPEGAMAGKYDANGDDLSLKLNVTSEETRSNDHVIGYLYVADIVVMSSIDAHEIYSITTSRYVSIDDGDNRNAVLEDRIVEADAEQSADARADRNAEQGVIDGSVVIEENADAPVTSEASEATEAAVM